MTRPLYKRSKQLKKNLENNEVIKCESVATQSVSKMHESLNNWSLLYTHGIALCDIWLGQHSKEGLGSFPGSLYGVCIFSLCLLRFPLDTLVSSHHLKAWWLNCLWMCVCECRYVSPVLQCWDSIGPCIGWAVKDNGWIDGIWWILEVWDMGQDRKSVCWKMNIEFEHNYSRDFWSPWELRGQMPVC